MSRVIENNFLQRVAQVIKDYQITKGRSPTQREIAKKVNSNERRVNLYVHT